MESDTAKLRSMDIINLTILECKSKHTGIYTIYISDNKSNHIGM